MGGGPSFADTAANGKVAPEAALHRRVVTRVRSGSIAAQVI